MHGSIKLCTWQRSMARWPAIVYLHASDGCRRCSCAPMSCCAATTCPPSVRQGLRNLRSRVGHIACNGGVHAPWVQSQTVSMTSCLALTNHDFTPAGDSAEDAALPHLLPRKDADRGRRGDTLRGSMSCASNCWRYMESCATHHLQLTKRPRCTKPACGFAARRAPVWLQPKA